MYCISELDFNPKSVLYVARALPTRDGTRCFRSGLQESHVFLEVARKIRCLASRIMTNKATGHTREERRCKGS